jgi:hypothetical protein
MTIKTPRDFASALLAGLGVPTSSNNIQTIISAEAIEGGFMSNAAAYNPLNTTQTMPGSHGVTGVGVQAYTSWDQGLQAIIKTLKNGYYNDILASLKQSAAPDDTLRVWQLNPMYGWYSCVDPVTQKKYDPGVCPAGSTKVPNPIGTSASYQSYADRAFPSGPVPSIGSQPATTAQTIGKVGLAGALGYFLYKWLFS